MRLIQGLFESRAFARTTRHEPMALRRLGSILPWIAKGDLQLDGGQQRSAKGRVWASHIRYRRNVSMTCPGDPCRCCFIARPHTRSMMFPGDPWEAPRQDAAYLVLPTCEGRPD